MDLPTLLTIIFLGTCTIAFLALTWQLSKLNSREKDKQIKAAQDTSLKIIDDAHSATQDYEKAAKDKFFELAQQAQIEMKNQLSAATPELEKSVNEYIKFLEELRVKADQVEQANIGKVATELEMARTEYVKFLEDLKAKAVNNQTDSDDVVKKQINTLFSRFEENLISFLTQTEQNTVSTIEMELSASRRLIETYKKAQLKLIDENIIAILERTLSLVLTKKLNLKDQMDLVYESIERAKIEKFLD